VLRNHIAQKAVEMAEEGDFSEVRCLIRYVTIYQIFNSQVRKVLKMLETPYSKDLLSEDTCPVRQSSPESVSTSQATRDEPGVGFEPAIRSYFNKPPLTAVGVTVT
jgi:hypothetical protein